MHCQFHLAACVNPIYRENIAVFFQVNLDIASIDCHQHIADELLRMTGDSGYRSRMLSDYKDMMALLGEKDPAMRTAADIERIIQEK